MSFGICKEFLAQKLLSHQLVQLYFFSDITEGNQMAETKPLELDGNNIAESCEKLNRWHHCGLIEKLKDTNIYRREIKLIATKQYCKYSSLLKLENFGKKRTVQHYYHRM